MKQVIKLSSAAGWFEANVGQKCLQVLTQALDIQESVYDESADDKKKKQNRKAKKTDNVIHEMTAIVIQNILLEVKSRVYNK